MVLPARTRTVNAAVVVDPVAILVRQYRAAIMAIAKRISLGTLLPDSYLAAQIPFILKELGRLDAFSKVWAERQVPAAYRTGAAVAQREIIAASSPLLRARFTGVDGRATLALVSRTSSELSSIVTALTQGLLGGERPNTAKAVGLMREALIGDGKTVLLRGRGLAVRVPSGRYWDVDAYARMEGRTATSDALRVGRRMRYLQNGVDVVVVISTGTICPICAPWEGEQLSLTGATPDLPTPEEAREDGLWHPNCEHSYVIDGDAEQPERDLTEEAGSEEEANFPTLGLRPPEIRISPTSRIRMKIAETIARR